MRREQCDNVDEEGRARLYPSLTNPNWLILRARREIFRRWLGRVSQSQMLVLDIGGRVQPYRPLIGAEKLHYVAVDLRPSSLVDVVADAAGLPFPDERFDLIICTQVMEYAANPFHVVAEIYRLLKPGAYLLLSVPTIYPPDSDSDGWRYLPAAIRQLTSQFAAVEIAAEGSSVIGIFRTLLVWLDWFARPALLRTAVRYTIVPSVNLMAVFLAALVRTRNEAMSANYSVLAQK